MKSEPSAAASLGPFETTVLEVSYATWGTSHYSQVQNMNMKKKKKEKKSVYDQLMRRMLQVLTLHNDKLFIAEN